MVVTYRSKIKRSTKQFPQLSKQKKDGETEHFLVRKCAVEILTDSEIGVGLATLFAFFADSLEDPSSFKDWREFGGESII